jgi:hypothetical protein
MRAKYATRPFLVSSEQVRETLLNAIRNLPIDADKPLQVVIREEVKVRRLDANARMWAGPLKDIAEQAWIEGKQHSAEVWHHFFKREFLPEEFDEALCKEGYVKYEYDPSSERVLVGSSTQLTVKGFAEYMTAIEAFGANLGVQFSASPNEGRS